MNPNSRANFTSMYIENSESLFTRMYQMNILYSVPYSFFQFNKKCTQKAKD